MRLAPQRAVLLAMLAASLFLMQCSSGSLATVPPPVFTNTPGTAATQGSTYTYQIQSQPSTGVTFTLMIAPSGAVLAGNTITWTPTAGQSRVPNQFSVTAATSGGSTTLFWSVNPAGTVSGTWTDAYWTPGGLVPLKLLLPPGPVALIPQPDGSFQTIQGLVKSDGTFSIPKVPGGYYWLQFGLGLSMYWSSSSTIDLGQQFDSQPGLPVILPAMTTNLQVDYAGLDPLQTGDDLTFMWGPLSFGFMPPPTSATTWSTSISEVNSTIDYSQPSPAFLIQQEPENLGSRDVLRLGPAEMIPSLALQNGTTNTVAGTLTPSLVKSFPLSIKGSAWQPLFNNAAPAPVTTEEAYLSLLALPFVTGDGAPSIGPMSLRLPLLTDIPPLQAFRPLGPVPASVCDPSFPVGRAAIGDAPITTDQDFGTVSYGDPFPSSWQRIFTFCQIGTVSNLFPGSPNLFPFFLVDTQSTSIPTSQITPLIGQVQNPTINGASLFQPNTVASAGVTLNWTAPNGTPPTGYEISTYIVTFSNSPGSLGGTLARSFMYYTAKTSAALPPLQSGQTYVFIISAILDGAANFETQPNRSALPTASVSVISAPITTQ